MMGIDLKLILTCYIVHSALLSVRPHPQNYQILVTSKVNGDGAIQKNFQNLIDSIAKNELKIDGDIYRDSLMRVVARERQVFNVMKGELRTAHNKNTPQKINSHKKNTTFENVAPAKRETKKIKVKDIASHEEKLYEQDAEILEKWYLELHPNLNNLQWPEVDNLLQKTHRKLCDQVFQTIQPLFDLYTFVEEVPPNPEGLSKRIRAPVLLELKKEMVSVSVAECIYKHGTRQATESTTTIYLTNANSSRVFILRKDEEIEVFYLYSGLHPVSYSVY